MKKKELFYIIGTDLYRYYRGRSIKHFIKAILSNGGFQLSICYRFTHYLMLKQSKILLILSKIILKFVCTIYNCELHARTYIGSGLYLSHCTGIIISGHSIIGDNVNISHQVTIGIAGRGNKRGVPKIGNNVYIGPGAKIFGKIEIGNNTAIGANAVITKDLPAKSVAVGIPGRVISDGGSSDFILNTDYDNLL